MSTEYDDGYDAGFDDGKEAYESKLSDAIQDDECAKKAKPGEPIFILLAHDPDAPAVVRYWAKLQRDREGDSTKITSAIGVAYDMEMYQKRHDDD